MRYEGNFKTNFMNAIGSNDVELQKDMLLDEVASLINSDIALVADALNKSGVKISQSYSKREIAEKVSSALHGNKDFQNNIAVLIAKKKASFKNADGVSVAVDPVSIIAKSLSDIFGNIGDVVGSVQERKSEQEKTKQALLGKIFGGDSQKINYTPLIIVGGVLLIGGIIAAVVLKGK